MNIDEFWKLIDKTRIESKDNPEIQAELLEETLIGKSIADIVDFHWIFEQLRDDARSDYIWDAAYIIQCGCGNDALIDFCAWLVAQGKQVYANAVQDPETLADYIDVENKLNTRLAEKISYVGIYAYRKKTDSDVDYVPDPNSEIVITYDFEFSNNRGCGYSDTGDPIDLDSLDECMRERYPKLWAKFGW